MPLERLQKVLAASGVASRRASEVLIANGRVTVDGKPAKLGMQVDPDKAVIAVDGRVIGAASAPEYLLLHKPAGVTSTVRDRHASKTVLDMIPTALLPEGGRLYPVGRLDQDSEGLLVLTNDGAWADRVLHPRHGIEREYAIGLRAPLTGEQVAALKAGIPLDEGLATADRAPADDRDRDAPARRRSSRRRPATWSGTGRSWRRAGSASCAGCSARSAPRSTGWSGSGSGRSGSTTCRAAARAACARPEVRGLGAGAGTSRAGRQVGDGRRTERRRPAAAGPPPMTGRGRSGTRGSSTAAAAPRSSDATVTIEDGRIAAIGTGDGRARRPTPSTSAAGR